MQDSSSNVSVVSSEFNMLRLSERKLFCTCVLFVHVFVSWADGRTSIKLLTDGGKDLASNCDGSLYFFESKTKQAKGYLPILH